MRLVIHAGPPKTGSSFIQETCVINQGKLIDQGVFYPSRSKKTTFSDQMNANYISIQLWNGHLEESLTSVLDLVEEAEARGCGTTLISGEGFSIALPAPKETAREFMNRLSERFDLKVVFVYRNFIDTANSVFSQRLKSFEKWIPLDEFYRSTVTHYFNRTNRLIRLAAEYPEAGFAVPLFSRRDGPFSSVSAALDLDSQDFRDPENIANARLHAATIALSHLAGKNAIRYERRELEILERHVRERRFPRARLTVVPFEDERQILERQRKDLDSLLRAENIELLGDGLNWWDEALTAQQGCIQIDDYLKQLPDLSDLPAPFDRLSRCSLESR